MDYQLSFYFSSNLDLPSDIFTHLKGLGKKIELKCFFKMDTSTTSAGLEQSYSNVERHIGAKEETNRKHDLPGNQQETTRVAKKIQYVDISLENVISLICFHLYHVGNSNGNLIRGAFLKIQQSGEVTIYTQTKNYSFLSIFLNYIS